MRLAQARAFADRVVAVLEPACSRIEIAGSIRRLSPEVGDVEIVAVPRGIPINLFGEPGDGPNDLDRLIAELIMTDRVRPRLTSLGSRRMGQRFKALESPGGAKIDLFAVLPPAQWGAIFAIRTGPADYSRRLVTSARERGLRCLDGRLIDSSHREVQTPDEASFIRACGMQWLDPSDRIG